MQKKISIIIPIYNAEKYLNKCIDSLINQTYTNLEIILINDGSTDSSGKIADRYAKKDNRIKVFHQSNAGVSAARNYGIQVSSGEYITFVDSDDYVEINMFELLIPIFHNASVDVVVSNLFFENEDGSIYFDSHYKNGIIEKEEFAKGLLMERSISGYCCNKIYKRSSIVNNNIKFSSKLRVLEDNFFNDQILLKQKKLIVYYVDDKFYHYVKHSSSISNSFFSTIKYDYLKARSKEIEIFDILGFDTNLLMIDYCAAYIRMKYLSKINHFDNTLLKENYHNSFIIYKKNIKPDKKNKKIYFKYLSIKYFNILIYVKILLKG